MKRRVVRDDLIVMELLKTSVSTSLFLFPLSIWFAFQSQLGRHDSCWILTQFRRNWGGGGSILLFAYFNLLGSLSLSHFGSRVFFFDDVVPPVMEWEFGFCYS